MIYIDSDEHIWELVKLWFEPNSGEIETGNSIDKTIQKLRQGVCTILINPWEHIGRYAEWEISPQVGELIWWIKHRIIKGTCVVFWWTGEIDILWTDSVRSELFNKTGGKPVIEMMLEKNHEPLG